MSMRHWLDKKEDEVQLIVLTDEGCYAQTGTAQETDQLLAELQAGKSPATAFAQSATHVPIRTLTQVKRNHFDDDIDFNFNAGKESKEESITIDDSAVRDAVFDALEQQMRDQFQRYEDQHTRPRAAFGALVALTIFGLGTWGLRAAAIAFQTAEEVEISGRKKGLKQLFVWVLETLGPTGVTVIGGLICALSAWVLVNQLRNPPLMHILQAKPYKPQSGVVTAIKYGVLAVVWVFVVRIVLG